MKYPYVLQIAFFAIISIGINPAQAQHMEKGRWFGEPMEEGRWFGQMFHPTGQSVNLYLNVKQEADSLAITLEIPDFRSFPLHDAQLYNNELTFWWHSSVRLECSMKKQEDRSFQGGCVDIWGGRAPFAIVPPGFDPDSFNINVDDFFADWKPPEPPKSLTELVAEEEENAPGTMVDMGGYHLNMHVQGKGDITVVLETGLGDDLSIWSKVAAGLKDKVRIVAYDRAGLGYSESSPLQRTPEQMAMELHEMLKNGDIAPPYVLVGHAEGGFTVRQFASLYPEEVVGAVLVDASHEEQGIYWNELDPASWKQYLDQKNTFYTMMSGALQAEYDAFLHVMEDGKIPEIEMLPEIPLTILTAMRPVEKPKWIGETEKGLQVKHTLHKSWADRAAMGTHVVAKNSGPYIHREEPELVIEVILNVLNRARKEGAH